MLLCLKRMEAEDVCHLYLYVAAILWQEVYGLVRLLCPVDIIPQLRHRSRMRNAHFCCQFRHGRHIAKPYYVVNIYVVAKEIFLIIRLLDLIDILCRI